MSLTKVSYSMIQGSPLNVVDFGAVGDGVTDDTAAIQQAINSANGNIVVGIEGKTYLVSTISLPSNTTLKNISLLAKPSSTNFNPVLKVDGTSLTSANPITNIFVENVYIDGNRNNQSNITYPSEMDGGRHGINFLGWVSNVILKNVTCTMCGTDGLEFFDKNVDNVEGTYCFNNILIDGCTFTWNGRHGMAADSINYLTITNSTFNNNGLPTSLAGTTGHELNTDGSWARWSFPPTVPGPSYGCGIDIESNQYPGNGFANLVIDSNNMQNNGGDGLMITEQKLVSDYTNFVSRGPFVICNNIATRGQSNVKPKGIGIYGNPAEVSGNAVFDYVSLSNNIVLGSTIFQNAARVNVDSSNIFKCGNNFPEILNCTDYNIAENIFFDTNYLLDTGSKSTNQTFYAQASASQTFTAGTDNIIVFGNTIYSPSLVTFTSGTTFKSRFPAWFKVTVQFISDTLGTDPGTLQLGYKRNGIFTISSLNNITKSSNSYIMQDELFLSPVDSVQFFANPQNTVSISLTNAYLVKLFIEQI